jgi:hypothetical protein
MAEVHKAPSRDEVRDILLDEWARTNGIHLARFDAGQLWLIFFGLQVVGFLGELAPLKRILVIGDNYFCRSAPIIFADGHRGKVGWLMSRSALCASARRPFMVCGSV